MYKGNRYLGLIPARGGSKRLPRKNIRPLGSMPLIQWTIQSALDSQYLDSVVVSTEDNDIGKVVRDSPKCMLLDRPEELAQDESSSFSVAKHAIESLPEKFDYLMLLQPTSPFRFTKDIDESIEYGLLKQANAVIGVCECTHPPLLANQLPSDRSMSQFFNEEFKGKRTQDLPKYYRVNGAIYLCEISTFLKEETFYPSDRVFGFEMPEERSLDIDSPLDFEFAQFMASKLVG